MYDPFLTPIFETMKVHHLEDVRTALQHIPVVRYTCEWCGSDHPTPTAMFACEEDCQDMRPRD